MPLDAFFLTAILTELTDQIVGTKIDKVQQPEQDQVLLTLRGNGGSRRLLISAGTGDARLHLTESSFENPANPPMFCMLLRKYILGARITAVNQPPLERSVDLTLDCVDSLGDPGQKHLILELMGRYSNIILTGADGRIIECLRRVDTTMSEKRQVLPGLFYRLPPMQDKRHPLETTRELWDSLWELAPGDLTADRWLLNTFGGMSPLVCREIVSRAYGETDTRLNNIKQMDKASALREVFFTLTADIKAARFEPILLTGQDGKPFDFSYTNVRQYGSALQTELAEGFSVLLDTFYTRRFTLERLQQRSQALTKSIRTASDRIKRKLENQREELKGSAGRERLRELGDLITANLHLITRGMTVLRVQDYYSETAAEVDIRLDPLKTPQQNAAKYYKDYTKARNAEIVLKEQIRIGENELEYLYSVLDEMSRAETERDLSEIRQELALTGYIKEQKTKKKEKLLQALPMRFISSTGFEISVGRNNVQNDLLTNKLAYKTDVWLHTQKIPGSHVIISANGGEPDMVTLGEAAGLAAWYSQARESKKVPVDYALVKHVRKIPGGRPGMVTYTDFKTITAEPSEELAMRLKKK